MYSENRIVTSDWDLYDTRHVVYRPARLHPQFLKDGYDWAYREFYRWSSIARASLHHGSLKHQAKHFFYAVGWKKLEPLWDLMIRLRQLPQVTPLLEAVLSKVTGQSQEHQTPELPAPVSSQLVRIQPAATPTSRHAQLVSRD
jgi:hypothetical protein